MRTVDFASLEQRIKSKKALVGIMGMGYVGLPLVRTFGHAGFATLGYDIDDSKIKMLNAGKSYIKHIPSSTVAELVKKRGFRATSDAKELSKADALIICVPTPLSKMRDPDM